MSCRKGYRLSPILLEHSATGRGLLAYAPLRFSPHFADANNHGMRIGMTLLQKPQMDADTMNAVHPEE